MPFCALQTFYELYEDDAQIGADELNWKLIMWVLYFLQSLLIE